MQSSKAFWLVSWGWKKPSWILIIFALINNKEKLIEIQMPISFSLNLDFLDLNFLSFNFLFAKPSNTLFCWFWDSSRWILKPLTNYCFLLAVKSLPDLSFLDLNCPNISSILITSLPLYTRFWHQVFVCGMCITILLLEYILSRVN